MLIIYYCKRNFVFFFIVESVHKPHHYWRQFSAQEHGCGHTFTIHVRKDYVWIEQAYYGYYTDNEWNDVDGESLQVARDMPEPVLPGWRRPLDENPLFRGTLQRRAYFALILNAIGDIVNQRNIIDNYIHLTGIELGAQFANRHIDALIFSVQYQELCVE